MGNKASTTPSASQVRTPQRTPSRRNSEYRSRTVEVGGNEGRRWSAAVVNPQRSLSIKPQRLSPRQRNLIIKSWSKMNKLKIAKDTFIDLFKTSDVIRSKFIFAEVPLKRIKQDDRFLSHCERFVAALDHVIAHLDQISAVIESAEALGRKHSTLVKAIRHEQWQIFVDVLVDRIIDNEPKQLGNEVPTAWKMLGQLLVFHLRLGYDRETLRNARSNRLTTNTSQVDKNHLYITDRGVPFA